ncbi:uncharacterized protein VTP21DRAFT_2389 [Calcarisporiella thermophila]|uniref:uncharacterized protein n=1 Tax=Calcarisporiella thermophila TaxID=911321 RepID=UPI003743F00E
MAARLLAQIIVMGTQVVGRAFIEAYKQAAANAARGGAAGAAAGKTSADALTRKTGMSFEEACQILNVNRNSTLEEITKKYDHLFKVNDSSSGGSFYLQSKVVRAKERYEMELKELQKKEQQTQANTNSGGSS